MREMRVAAAIVARLDIQYGEERGDRGGWGSENLRSGSAEDSRTECGEAEVLLPKGLSNTTSLPYFLVIYMLPLFFFLGKTRAS